MIIHYSDTASTCVHGDHTFGTLMGWVLGDPLGEETRSPLPDMLTMVAAGG